MSIEEFLAVLPEIREQFIWFQDEMGQLRACRPALDAVEHSTITAMMEVRTSHIYCCVLEWDQAAKVLGLSLEDACTIVAAEDQDSTHDPALARALRAAVGIDI